MDCTERNDVQANPLYPIALARGYTGLSQIHQLFLPLLYLCVCVYFLGASLTLLLYYLFSFQRIVTSESTVKCCIAENNNTL